MKFTDYIKKDTLNEAMSKYSLGWIENEITKSGLIEEFVEKVLKQKFDKSKLQIMARMWASNKYYGDTFWIRPVNSRVGLNSGTFRIMYDGKVVFDSKTPMLLAGDVIANTSNSTLAGVRYSGGVSWDNALSGDAGNLFVAHPGNDKVHKIYKNQDNYEVRAPSSKLTYYDTAKLTSKAYKEIVKVAKQSGVAQDIVQEFKDNVTSKLPQKDIKDIDIALFFDKSKKVKTTDIQTKFKNYNLIDVATTKSVFEATVTGIDVNGFELDDLKNIIKQISPTNSYAHIK